MSLFIGSSFSPSDSEKYHLLPEGDSETDNSIADVGQLRLDLEKSRINLCYEGSKKHWLPIFLLLVVAANLMSGLLGFYIGQARFIRAEGFRGTYEDSAWDALKEGALTYETQTFDGHFVNYSEYQGPPNPSLDEKWRPISALYNFGLEKSTLAKANKTRGLVQWPNTTKYMVGLEAFHHLHCLNYIRMYTYMDYYENKDEDMLIETLDDHHCIEVLRQKLMCTPDVNVYSYHWLSTINRPFTDFTTQHRCVNWSRFFEWSKGQTVRHGALIKPEGAETLF